MKSSIMLTAAAASSILMLGIGTVICHAADETETADEIEVPQGYHLVWNDEFDSRGINEDDWNYELHEAGWVNHELQEYVRSEDSAYTKDGELVIQPLMLEGADGDVSYESSRLTTQNKHDFKYGRMEARLKVPEGTGFLPAFWLMATDEDLYGQWPKCGEIDIMEVLGKTGSTATIHIRNVRLEKTS